MHDMTAGNLRSAYGGESMAHMRYKIWGAKAEQDGLANIARMFQAISRAEQVHATNHFTELKNEAGGFVVTSMAGFGLGTTSENLQGAIDGETFEITEMYPAYMDVARMQEEKGAVRSFNYAVTAEKIHAAMFTSAKQSADEGKDIDLGPVQICLVCGHTREGDAPEKCPVCSSPKEKFQAFA